MQRLGSGFFVKPINSCPFYQYCLSRQRFDYAGYLSVAYGRNQQIWYPKTMNARSIPNKSHNWDDALKLYDTRSLAKAMRLLFITNNLVSCSCQFQRDIESQNPYSHILVSEVVDKRTHQQHLAWH
jgi:hypothetical protein